MKRKQNSERFAGDTPEWTEKTFERGQPASEVLPGLRDEEYLRLKVLTCMLPEL